MDQLRKGQDPVVDIRSWGAEVIECLILVPSQLVDNYTTWLSVVVLLILMYSCRELEEDLCHLLMMIIIEDLNPHGYVNNYITSYLVISVIMYLRVCIAL